MMLYFYVKWVNTMNDKSSKLINTLICVLVIIFIAIIFVGVKRDNEKKSILNKYISTKNVKSKTQTTKTSDTVSGTYIYDKLSENQNISAVIIGDSFGEGDGVADSQKWNIKLSSLMKAKYKSEMQFKLISSPLGSVFDGWCNYLKIKDTTKYDSAFICFGQNDSSTLSLKQFQNIYEALIRKIKITNGKCEIYLMIENSTQINADMINTIQNLSKYYDLQVIDCRNVSGDVVAQYDTCSSKIIELINSNVNSKRKVDYADKACQYDGADAIGTYNFNPEVTKSNGFTKGDGCYTSSIRGNFLNYKVSGTFAGIDVKCGSSYGKVNVYLNGKLMKVFDCYSEADSERQILCYDEIHKGNNNEIKIEVSGNKNDNSKGTSISVIGIISN